MLPCLPASLPACLPAVLPQSLWQHGKRIPGHRPLVGTGGGRRRQRASAARGCVPLQLRPGIDRGDRVHGAAGRGRRQGHLCEDKAPQGQFGVSFIQPVPAAGRWPLAIVPAAGRWPLYQPPAVAPAAGRWPLHQLLAAGRCTSCSPLFPRMALLMQKAAPP
jgi:hypothetical protein